MLHAIFDLDGTLVDSMAVCTDIMNAMLVDRGSTLLLTPDVARPHISIGGSNMIASCLGEFCEDPHAGIAEFRARYIDMPTPETSIFAGVREGLQRLSDSGYSMSICSNKPQNLCEKILAELRLEQFFGTVVGGRPGIPAKPSPDLLDLTLRLSGHSAEDSCFVGDSEPDHLAARALGIPFILVSYGYGELEGPCDDVARCGSFWSVPDNIDSILNVSGLPRRAAAR